MTETVLVERQDRIARLVLNRPRKLNALDLATWRQLAQRFTELDRDPELRCVVLSGAGDKAFSAGADISAFGTERSNLMQGRRYGEAVHGAMRAVAECQHPVVASIRGVCVGGGLELASVCDLRICGRSSRFGIPVNQIGVTMAYGELEGLLRLVSPATALQVLLEAQIFDAQEAKEMGLVNRVVEDGEVEAEVARTVARIASGAPLVNRWHKKFIRRLADPRPLSEAEIEEGYRCFGSEDFQAGYRAFLAKGRPSFQGR